MKKATLSLLAGIMTFASLSVSAVTTTYAVDSDDPTQYELTYCTGDIPDVIIDFDATEGYAYNVTSTRVDNNTTNTVQWYYEPEALGNPEQLIFTIYRYELLVNNELDIPNAAYYGRNISPGKTTYNLLDDSIDPVKEYVYAVVAWNTECQGKAIIPDSYTDNLYGTDFNYFTDNGIWATESGTMNDNYYTGDFDGDGVGDILYSTTSENNNGKAGDNDLAWYFLKGSSQGFLTKVRWNDSYGLNSDNYFVSDFNGDGKDDVLISTTRDDYNKDVDQDLAWYLMISNGSTFIDGGKIDPSYGVNIDSYYAGDMNGDGRDDMIVSTYRVNGNGIEGDNDLAWYLMISNGTSFVDGGQINNSFGLYSVNDLYYPTDFNGDGKTDMYVGTSRVTDGTTYAWYLMTSNGATFLDGGKIADSIGYVDEEIYIGDGNNDGKDDIYIASTVDNLLYWYVADATNTGLDFEELRLIDFGTPDSIVLINQFAATKADDIAVGSLVGGKVQWSLAIAR